MQFLNLYISEDNLITWAAMTLASTEALIDNATAYFQLRKQSDESTVTGASSGTMMTITSTATCNYQGVMGSTVALIEGVKYWLDITVSTTAGANAFRRIPARGTYHHHTS